MSAFLILTIGASRTMAKTIATKLKVGHTQLSPSSWIIRADDGVSPRDIAERVDIMTCPEEVIVIELNPATLNAYAEPNLARWLTRRIGGE